MNAKNFPSLVSAFVILTGASASEFDARLASAPSRVDLVPEGVEAGLSVADDFLRFNPPASPEALEALITLDPVEIAAKYGASRGVAVLVYGSFCLFRRAFLTA